MKKFLFLFFLSIFPLHSLVIEITNPFKKKKKLVDKRRKKSFFSRGDFILVFGNVLVLSCIGIWFLGNRKQIKDNDDYVKFFSLLREQNLKKITSVNSYNSKNKNRSLGSIGQDEFINFVNGVKGYSNLNNYKRDERRQSIDNILSENIDDTLFVDIDNNKLSNVKKRSIIVKRNDKRIVDEHGLPTTDSIRLVRSLNDKQSSELDEKNRRQSLINLALVDEKLHGRAGVWSAPESPQDNKDNKRSISLPPKLELNLSKVSINKNNNLVVDNKRRGSILNEEEYIDNVPDVVKDTNRSNIVISPMKGNIELVNQNENIIEKELMTMSTIDTISDDLDNEDNGIGNNKKKNSVYSLLGDDKDNKDIEDVVNDKLDSSVRLSTKNVKKVSSSKYVGSPYIKGIGSPLVKKINSDKSHKSLTPSKDLIQQSRTPSLKIKKKNNFDIVKSKSLNDKQDNLGNSSDSSDGLFAKVEDVRNNNSNVTKNKNTSNKS